MESSYITFGLCLCLFSLTIVSSKVSYIILYVRIKVLFGEREGNSSKSFLPGDKMKTKQFSAYENTPGLFEAYSLIRYSTIAKATEKE